MPRDDPSAPRSAPIAGPRQDVAARIHQAMVAFAAGDALGVPWEGRGPERIDLEEVVRLPAPDRGWPRGSTSDDTAQMVLVACCLADTGGRPTTLGFLTRLAEAAPAVRGLGPTTRHALAHFHATGEPPAPSAGDRPTNGAAMRVAPIGWAVPTDRPGLRRRLCEVVSAATHRAPAAVAAARVIAALASHALEGESVPALLEVAADEARRADEHLTPTPADDAMDDATEAAGDGEAAGGHPAPVDAVIDAAYGRWTPPSEGVSLDAVETVAAVVHVLREAPALAAALPYAVSLGGDTDTVAALVGGVLGAREPEGVAALDWLGPVDLGEYPALPDLAARLAALRAAPPPP
ncbi:ADP-ribosylglycohydrolase family protein [Microbispora sp. H10885]|uniref:ADP-ribosylglycohydrolase family protein n=1 Tax=Microbispora sp. H10885 TaxID=2729110 RepID=UPI0016015DE7|nr:ADP-ribosylglycohydrolase family protein [Microbispora sp. H10885]